MPLITGVVVRCRPIGALLMEDEAGTDEKIVGVPADDLHPFYTSVRSYRDLPPIHCEQIAHFFSHYKDLEPGKWVKIVRWADAAEAARAAAELAARRSYGKLVAYLAARSRDVAGAEDTLAEAFASALTFDSGQRR